MEDGSGVVEVQKRSDDDDVGTPRTLLIHKKAKTSTFARTRRRRRRTEEELEAPGGRSCLRRWVRLFVLIDELLLLLLPCCV